MTDTARREAGRAAHSPVFRGAARAGFAASGLVQGLVGVLAIQVALQGGGREADQSGALETLAKAPFGAVLLWIAAIASIALALWLILDGILEPSGEHAWKERLKSWGKAVVYGAIGITGLSVALGGGSSSSGSSKRGTATVLSLPGGQVLLVVIGLAVVVLGGYLVRRGWTESFRETIDVPSGPSGRGVVVLGRIGYIARGVAIAMVGILFVVAAVTTDPKKASGLDGALHAFAQLPFGKVLLVLIGLGWIASGVYSVFRAKLARLD